MDKIAILIPCYNEELTIEKVVKDFKRVLPDAVVYVYNNNSTDRTAEIAKRTGAIVRNEYQQGKGNVIRRMFREIDAECYIMVDGDDTYPAEHASQMADLVLKKNVDMVVGDRLSSTYYEENKRPFHNFGNWIVQKSINTLFNSDIKDIMTGYRAFSYQFVKSFPVLSRGFEIETEMTIHAIDKNLFIQNTIIAYRDRPKGSISKLSTYSDGIKVICTIIKLFKDYKPLLFFSVISLTLALLSTVFFIPVLMEFIYTGMVPQFPTLVTCGFVMIAAIQSLFSGLVLDSMNQKDRRDFEMNLIRLNERRKNGENN